jgi:hypothetical protein
MSIRAKCTAGIHCATATFAAVAVAFACVLAGSGTPVPTECRSDEVKVTLSSIVREHFLWTVFADSKMSMDPDRLAAFTTATWVTIRLAQPLAGGKPGDVLGCAAVIGIAAPRFNDRFNVRTEGELAYRVIRQPDGSFLVEVPFKDLSDLANRAAKPLKFQSSL